MVNRSPAAALEPTDLFNVQRGPTAAFAANGCLGQHLVMVPEQRLVAVRLIHRRDTHARWQRGQGRRHTWSYGHSRFDRISSRHTLRISSASEESSGHDRDSTTAPTACAMSAMRWARLRETVVASA